MAEAIKTTREVPKVVEEDVVVLTLSKDEAETLRMICYTTGGHEKKSRRKYIDSIGKALEAAGISLLPDYGKNFSNRLWFRTVQELS
jgi:hypothetical protein